MQKRWTQRMFVTLLIVTTGCTEPESEDGVVARVGDYDLSVEEVVNLLINEERLPAQASVIQQVAELWIDYTLLGDAVAEDTTLAFLDFDELLRQQVNQVMILQLRDSVIQVDTAISDLELEEIYAAEDPELEIRASHILLQYPPQATLTQQDSVRAEILAIRNRIESGELFGTLATQYSQDRGSGAVGGDLGFFGRGEMVQPFEEAVLTLSPGEMTGPVETQFGVHLIRLEQLRTQNFEEVVAGLRNRIQTQRFLRAESTFVASIQQGAEPQPTENAYVVVREIADNPATRLSGRAGRRPVFEYSGGELTVTEVQLVLQAQSPDFQEQVVTGTDEQLNQFLLGLVQRELLVAEAKASGLEPEREVLDSMAIGARNQLRSAARALRFIELDRAPGEPTEQALSRAVLEAIANVLTGATEVIDLGAIGFQLEQRTSPYISDRGVGQAILRLGQLRANRSPSIVEEGTEVPNLVPDTLN